MLGEVLQVRLHGGCSLDEAATSHLNQPDDIGGAFFVMGCRGGPLQCGLDSVERDLVSDRLGVGELL
jgi:hypothetical protein